MGVEFALTAGSLRVRFVRRGDRFAHFVEQVVDDRAVVLLESIEGTAAEHWPASPPVQELEPAAGPRAGQSLGDQSQIVWLIGRAGASHWSASVEALPSGIVTFDIACRVHSAPDWLGSRYRVHDVPGGERLSIEPLADCQLASTDGRSELVVVAEIVGDTLPRTIRWRYRISARC
ncbi:MAG: hypothetical protein K2Y37_17355 [Pirellulales bacterium]|nr:hypothetical protein [Pirellulales bacterium]